MTEKEFQEILSTYKHHKDKEAMLTPVIKGLNDEIKNYMIHNNIDKYINDNCPYKASLSIQEKTNYNENLLIKRLKELDMNDCIITKEVVDFDKLEKLIYNEQFDENKIKDCSNKKITYTLRVTENKNGQN